MLITQKFPFAKIPVMPHDEHLLCPRVLHVVSSMDARSGGTSSAVAGMAVAQLRAGLPVEVLSTYRSGDDDSHVRSLRASGVAVTLVGPARGKLMRHPRLAGEVTAAVARNHIVHVHALWEEVQHLAARAARELDRPYVVSPHGMLDPWSLAQRRLVKRAYLWWRGRKDIRRARLKHFTAEAERDLASQALRTIYRPTVVPLGVDAPDPLPPRGGALRARLGIAPGDRVIACLGRLHPKKGLDVLIRGAALAGAAAGRPRVLLIGAGDEGYRRELVAVAASAGFADRLHFAGSVYGPAKYDALREADLFVLPSHQENFAIAVFEAMACALPVVISDRVNTHAEVTGSGGGFVLPLGPLSTAHQRLAALLDGPLADPAVVTRMGAAGRRYVVDHLQWGRIGSRWVAEYTDTFEDFYFDAYYYGHDLGEPYGDVKLW